MPSPRPALRLTDKRLKQYLEDVYSGREKRVLSQRLLDDKAKDEQTFKEAICWALEHLDGRLPKTLDGDECTNSAS